MRINQLIKITGQWWNPILFDLELRTKVQMAILHANEIKMGADTLMTAAFGERTFNSVLGESHPLILVGNLNLLFELHSRRKIWKSGVSVQWNLNLRKNLGVTEIFLFRPLFILHLFFFFSLYLFGSYLFTCIHSFLYFAIIHFIYIHSFL